MVSLNKNTNISIYKFEHELLNMNCLNMGIHSHDHECEYNCIQSCEYKKARSHT